MLIMSRGGGVSDGHQAAAVRLLLDIMSSIMRRARIAPASILRLRKGWSGSLSMARCCASTTTCTGGRFRRARQNTLLRDRAHDA
jgi:hypothetical protein